MIFYKSKYKNYFIKSANFDVSQLLKDRNIKTMSENAFELFEAGETTLEEIYSLLFNF